MERGRRPVKIGLVSRVTAVAFLVVLVRLSVPASATAAPASVTPVPIGSFDQPSLQTLAGHLQHQLHVRVRILPGFR
jgi:hypothetical protein